MGDGHEALGGQVGTPKIAARQLHPADVQLTRYAHRHRVEVPIQQVDLGVGDRVADRHAALGTTARASPEGDIDRRFGRTVQVVQFGIQPCEKALL